MLAPHNDVANFLAALAPGVTLPRGGGYVGPISDAGCHFVFGVIESGTTADSWKDRKLQPTTALYRDGMMILIWAFNTPVDPGESRLKELAASLEMAAIDEHIPEPGHNGWEQVRIDGGTPYAFDEVLAVYGVAEAAEAGNGQIDSTEPTEGPEDEAEVASETSGFRTYAAGEKYGDAVCVTAYNEANYSKEIVVTIGGNRQSKKWIPKTMPAGALMAEFSKHKEGKKDGLALVFADMVPGQRLKTSVKALYGVGLDIDTGTPTAVIDAALKKLGCLAVRCTTHSHNKTKSDFKKDMVVKFAGDREISTDLMREYVRTVEQSDPSIAEKVEYLREDHNQKGIVCVIQHPQMPKNRVFLPFNDQFVIADEGKTQAEAMKKWAKVPEALARVLGVPFDTSCTDPSRLFYLPRHEKGKHFSISLFGGPYFDWKQLELEDPMEKLNAAFNKGKSKSVTPEGRELGRWSLKRAHGFQIADVIEATAPDRIRHNTGHGLEIECPFDEDHSNAQDQEDRACLVVNAGEGPSEFFTISCFHETCRDKTNLDMLGKMIKDGWFERTAIEEEQFNAILEDDEKPELAVKIEGEDNARADYEAAIAALTPAFKQAQLEAAVALVIKANLPSAQFAKAQDGIKKATKLSLTAVRATFDEVRREQSKGSKTRAPARAPKGQAIFPYEGEYNFDEACDAVTNAVLAENTRRKLPVLCAMDGVMVRMETSANGDVEFVPLSYMDFWAYSLKLILFVEQSDKANGLREKVPEDVARACHANCRDWLPEAPEVVDAPSFLSNGDLLITAGYWYDPKENLNHLLRLDRFSGDVVVPEEPTEADAKAAVHYLKSELLVDFPFLDTDINGNERREPAEANALAMILTPFMRRKIEGCTPLFFIMKPDPGTGSTLLAGIPPIIFDGIQPQHLRYTPDAEEMSKNIVAGIQQPRSHMIFDNVTDFNSPELVRTLTAPFVSGRLLGSNNIVSRPNNFGWVATGINPTVRAEMERRICWIRMNAEGRSSDDFAFRHPTVSGYAFDQFLLAHRHIIIGHVLTMIQYWINKGMPVFTARRRASFEDWSAKVGGVLEVCGVEGFLDNKKFTGQDREKIAWAQIANRWSKRYGTGKDNSVTEDKIYDLACDPAVAIIRGHSEESRRSNFMDKLPSMTGKTFMFEVQPKIQKPFKVKCGTDDGGGVSYWFEPVQRTES